MEIIVDATAERVKCVLEVLRNFPFVKSARPKRAPKKATPDTTDYLLASPVNAERLRQAYEQFDRAK